MVKVDCRGRSKVKVEVEVDVIWRAAGEYFNGREEILLHTPLAEPHFDIVQESSVLLGDTPAGLPVLCGSGGSRNPMASLSQALPRDEASSKRRHRSQQVIPGYEAQPCVWWLDQTVAGKIDEVGYVGGSECW